MDVEAGGCGWVSLPRNEPGRSVVGIAIALVVHGNNVKENGVLLVGIQAREGSPDCWEHPPVNTQKMNQKHVIFLQEISSFTTQVVCGG